MLLPNDNWHIIMLRRPLYDLKWVWSMCISILRYRKKFHHNILNMFRFDLLLDDHDLMKAKVIICSDLLDKVLLGYHHDIDSFDSF